MASRLQVAIAVTGVVLAVSLAHAITGHHSAAAAAYGVGVLSAVWLLVQSAMDLR